MEKEKKVATKTAKKETVKKTSLTKAPTNSKKAQEVKNAEVKNAPVVTEKAEQPVVKTEKKGITLNQDLNLLVGLLALMTIVSFCFAFQGGEVEILGWQWFLKAAGDYSGVFKGLMIVYVASLFVDCILAIRVESENEIFNIVEKALYMFTLVINFIVVAVLLSVISKIGIGLIIFLILSIVSAIVKLARIYSQNK